MVFDLETLVDCRLNVRLDGYVVGKRKASVILGLVFRETEKEQILLNYSVLFRSCIEYFYILL